MIYLDNNATTRIAPEVFEAMRPYLTEHYGNPASAHSLGQKMKAAVENAREQVASLDEVERIREAPGEWFCPEHGAGMLCVAFKKIAEANVFYMNLPYGDAGAYVWI